MKSLVLTFDLEEFDLPLAFGIPIDDEEMYEISYEGLKKIAQILQKHEIIATFFTTVRFSEHYPDAVKDLDEQGHEIALHGYKHDHNYEEMDRQQAYKFINKGKKALEGITGAEITGFRAPYLKPPTYEVLKKAGIRYDSSLHPTYVPGRNIAQAGYNKLRSPRRPFVKDGMTVIPISTTPLLRLPFSWIWFRNLGVTYSKLCTRLSLLDQDYINIYFHPWEFADLAAYRLSRDLPKLIIRNTGRRLEGMMHKYISWCRKDAMAMTMRDYFMQGTSDGSRTVF